MCGYVPAREFVGGGEEGTTLGIEFLYHLFNVIGRVLAIGIHVHVHVHVHVGCGGGSVTVGEGFHVCRDLDASTGQVMPAGRTARGCPQRQSIGQGTL
jgi:hypothetical protein